MKKFKDFKKKPDIEDNPSDLKDPLPAAKMPEPGEQKKLKGGDTLIFNPEKGDVNLVKEESEGSTAAVAWGRMNPPTVGHARVADSLKSIATAHKAKPYLFLSHSQDKEKNPLPYQEKIKYARAAFGDMVKKANHKNIIDVAKSLQNKHKHLVLVVGSDRVKEFDSLLKKYNGKEFNFDSVKVVSAGHRDEEANDVSGMSASKMRAAVKSGDVNKFASGLPDKLKPHAEKIFKNLRKHMQIMEGYQGPLEIEEGELLGIVETVINRLTNPETVYRSPESVIRNIGTHKYLD